MATSMSTQSAMPIIIFLVTNRLVGLRWAVVAATVWSIKVLIDRRRQGLPLGRFMPAVTAAVLLRGAIGAATGSETVYFGLGIATKYAASAILIGSVLIGRPLAAVGAPYLLAVPAKFTGLPLYRSTMSIITMIGALYYAVSASFDVWLFRRSSVEGYVVVRFLANWPLGVVAILAIAAIAQRRLGRIPGLAPLSSLMERRLETFGVVPARPDRPG